MILIIENYEEGFCDYGIGTISSASASGISPPDSSGEASCFAMSRGARVTFRLLLSLLLVAHTL